MQEEHGDDLQIVFVEVQGSDAPAVERFALGRKWFGTDAVWTTERPVRTNARGIPNCVVLDAEGRVALMGHPVSLHKEIEELVASSKRARVAKPEGLPRQLDRAWKSFAKGEHGAAWKECQAVIGRGPEEAVVSYAQELAERAQSAASRAVARIERMVEEGWVLEAKDFAGDLAEQVEGLENEVGAVDGWIERFDSEEFEAELAAAKALARFERKLFQNGMDPGLAGRLERIADKYAGTKAAERAARYAGAE